ncbi:MAG: heme-copper oxidase subunit III [Acidimicrobiia bacterium]
MSTIATTFDVNDLPAGAESRHTSGWWGAMLAILTEATLFASLIAAYFYLRLRSDVWPIGGIEEPKLLLGGIGLAVLAASSVVIWSAERMLRRGRTTVARVAVAATVVLGVAFLVLQYLDFQDKHFGIDTNAYGTIYYAITGLHTAHVVAGLILLSFTLTRLVIHPGTRAGRTTLSVISLYWHFVDVVWLAVYTSLFLSERWF